MKQVQEHAKTCTHIHSRTHTVCGQVQKQRDESSVFKNQKQTRVGLQQSIILVIEYSIDYSDE